MEGRQNHSDSNVEINAEIAEILDQALAETAEDNSLSPQTRQEAERFDLIPLLDTAEVIRGVLAPEFDRTRYQEGLQRLMVRVGELAGVERQE